ncbi:Cullin-domain-containing protein [Aureobasidium sp. EXF-10727]|nr:Cullin-domain-containing protein [Aureobasidium sp. EXF-10727]
MSLPQALHLSVALALVKSKPKHLTIQDYFQTLHASIETIHHDHQALRHLNYSAFWHTQYENLQRALGKERDAMFVLQKENEALQAQITQLSVRSKPGRKRKMAEQEEPETVKKLKAASIAIAEFGSAADVDPVIKAMRHIHRVQILCRGSMWSTDSNELAYHLVQAMQALGLIIESLPRKVHVANTASKSVIAVARSCISVFNGLKRMESLENNDNFASHAVHACVCFFDLLFTSLEEGAAVQVRSRHPDQETPALQALSQLAKGLVENLRESAQTCRSHAHILEGAIYQLLHRLGEATHELLLDGPRNDNIEDEMRNLPLPDDKLLDPVRQTEMRTVLTSAPLLLDSLRKAVTDLHNMPFTGAARARLQRTLVDRIFGPGTRGLGASQDVLNLPKAVGEAPRAVEAVGLEDIQGKTDAFEAELWTLIGWDILGSEEDL